MTHKLTPGQIPRPWLSLYTPCSSNLLAERISVSSLQCEEDGMPLSGSFELWTLIAQQFGLAEFSAICALGGCCRSLRPLARLPELWEALCRQAYTLPGFRPAEQCLRLYCFSWRSMFQQRPRLRFDGLYYFTTTKLVHGLNEGRGMKEADKDFFNPAGNWVTTFRVLRFYPDGRLFSYLCSSHTPADIRKAASLLHPNKPQSGRKTQNQLKNLNWGSYDLFEGEAPLRAASDLAFRLGGGLVTLSASLIQHSEQYPNMIPCTLQYGFELRPGQDPRVGAAGCNCKLFLRAHSLGSFVNSQSDVEHFAVPDEPAHFISFTGPLPPMYPVRRWVSTWSATSV